MTFSEELSSELSKEKKIVGHVPDRLTEVLFTPFDEGLITMTYRVTGHSRSAVEGTWNQGGGIEIPCIYDVSIKADVRAKKIQLKEKHRSLKAADGGCGCV